MSTLSGIASKGDKSKAKFKTIDINNVYKGTSVGPQKTAGAARQHGLQSLGKVASRRMPPPAHLPSLRSEHGGAEPSVAIVPTGSSGWGSGAKEEDKASSGGTQPTTAAAAAQPSQAAGRSTQNSSAVKAAENSGSSPSGTAAATATTSGPQSWSSVTSGSRTQGKLTMHKSRFQEDFPELAAGADDKAQKKEDENKELQYGPGPSLRPQNVGSWREGGGRNIPAAPTADEDHAAHSPPSAAPLTAVSSEDEEAPQQPVFHPQSQAAVMAHMMRPGMGPGPRMGPGGPMMYGPMMPPFVFPGARFPPQFAGFPPPGPPFFHPDPRFRGRPMHPPRMAFDGAAPDRPPRPQSDRPAIIKDHALKEFDRLDPGDGSWADAVDSDVDYSAKLVFSDEEDAPSAGGKMDNRSMSARDRRSYKDRPSGRGKENEVADSSKTMTGKATSGDDERNRFRDRKRPPPMERENSSGSREPLSPQQMAPYGQFPVDMHWRRGMPPYGPRGMPVMYPAMPMPPGTMPGPKQPMYRRSDSAEAGHYASMFDNIEEEQQGSRDSDERRSAADKRRDDSKQRVDGTYERSTSESSDGTKQRSSQKSSTSQSSAGRGMVKLTSQRGRKSSPTEDAAVFTSTAASCSTGPQSADSAVQGRSRPAGVEPKPPAWGRPATQSDEFQKSEPQNLSSKTQSSGSEGRREIDHFDGDLVELEQPRPTDVKEEESKQPGDHEGSISRVKDVENGHVRAAAETDDRSRHSSAPPSDDRSDRSNRTDLEAGLKDGERHRTRRKEPGIGSWADQTEARPQDNRRTYLPFESEIEGSQSLRKDEGRSATQYSARQDRRRTDSRPSCPPPISLKQSQQNMSTRSKYTPLKRGGPNTSSASLPKPDAGQPPVDSVPSEDGAKLEKAKSKESLSEVHKDEISSIPKLLDLNLEETHKMWSDMVEDDAKSQEEERRNRTRDAVAFGRNDRRQEAGSADMRRFEFGRGRAENSRTDDRPPAKRMKDEPLYRSQRDDGYTRERADRMRGGRGRGKVETYRTGGTRGSRSSASDYRHAQSRDGVVSEYQPGRGEKRGTLTFERSDLHPERQSSFDNKRGQFRSSDSTSRQSREDRNRESRARDGRENSARKDDSRGNAGKPPEAQNRSETAGSSALVPSGSDREPVKMNAWAQLLHGQKQGSEPPQSEEIQDGIDWNATNQPTSDSTLPQQAGTENAPPRKSSDTSLLQNRDRSETQEFQGNDKEFGKQAGSRAESSQYDYRGDRGRRQSRRGRRPPSWLDQTEGGENLPRYGRQSQPRVRKEGRGQRSADNGGEEVDEATASREELNTSERQRTSRYGSSGRGYRQSGHGEYGMRSRGRGRSDYYRGRGSGEMKPDQTASADRSFDGDSDQRRDNRRRNFHRSGNTGAQLYGRARGGRGRVSGDETQPGRRGARTISQSQQLPKLPSQSTDQNLSDVGNEEWETASESSDVLAHHHVHETKPDEAKSSAGHEAGGPSGKRDQKKTFAGYRGDRSDRDSVSEPRSGSFDTRNSQHGPRNINNGNSRMNSRGSRDQAMSRNSTTSAADAANKNQAKMSDAKEEAAKAAAKAEKEKKDAMANIDINNYASVVVIDDQPEVSIDDPSFLFESNEGFQEVTSRRAQKSKQKAALEEAMKKSQEAQAQAAAQAKRMEKEAKAAARQAEQKRNNGKLPPRLNGRRDKKHSRGGLHASTNDEMSSNSAASSSLVVTREFLPKIENWENEVKIEKWSNDMARNIPAPSAITSESLAPRSSAAAIAIVPATPVGKWENPVVSLGTAGLDPSVAVVAPSVGEKTEVPDGSVDVAEPLVSSTSSILGSSTIDNKLRLTASVENAAAAIAVAKPLEVIGRQEMPQQAPVEINLSEMSPFISDVSQGQLQPQPQRPTVDTHGIKSLPKMDENRAIKKPDSATGRPARAAYEPIELPSSFPSGLFKGKDTSDLKLDFTYDANLASSMPAGEKSETGDSGVELPPPITMPPSAMMHRSTAVVSASVAELMPLQSPATDDLNLKIMSVKNVWEREHQGRTPLEQIFEQSLMQQQQQQRTGGLTSVTLTDDELMSVQQQQTQQQQQMQPSTAVPSYTDYTAFDAASLGQMSSATVSAVAEPDTSRMDELVVPALTTTPAVAAIMSSVSALEQTASSLIYMDPDTSSYATSMKDSRVLLNEQTNVCKVRPQLQASSSSSSPMAHMRTATGGMAAGLSANAAASQLMIAAAAAASGQNYQYAALGTSQLLTQDSTGIGFQYGQPYGYNLSQPTQAAAVLAPVGQNSLYLQGTALPTAVQQTDLYGASASTLAAYRNLFAPPPAQPNTIMVSSATSSLMSAAVKPAAQHLYLASGSQKSSQMASAVQYGQLVGNSALQPAAAQSQLCYQYDAAAQPALATSPVQSDPLMAAAAQSSQIVGSQLVQQRAAQLQALQASTNYYQQTPLQQTGFYQAQQTGSTLQGAYQQLSAQPYSVPTYSLQAGTMTLPVQPIHSQLKHSAPPFKPASQQVKTVVSSASNYTSLTSASQSTYIGQQQQQQQSSTAIYSGSLQQQQQLAGSGPSGGGRTTGQYQYYSSQSQQQQPAAMTSKQHLAQYYTGAQMHDTYQHQQQMSCASSSQPTAATASSTVSSGLSSATHWQSAAAGSQSSSVPAPASTSSSISQYQHSSPFSGQASADVGKSLSTATASKPGQVGHHSAGGSRLGYSFGVGSAGAAVAGAMSAQSVREQQEQDRRKALQHVQSFLNPQNKPPAKTAMVSGGKVAGSGTASALAKSEARKTKDDK